MTTLDESSWLMRFAASLQLLLPNCSMAVALQAGRVTYPSASALPPEEAARLYVEGGFHRSPLQKSALGTE